MVALKAYFSWLLFVIIKTWGQLAKAKKMPYIFFYICGIFSIISSTSSFLAVAWRNDIRLWVSLLLRVYVCECLLLSRFLLCRLFSELSDLKPSDSQSGGDHMQMKSVHGIKHCLFTLSIWSLTVLRLKSQNLQSSPIPLCPFSIFQIIHWLLKVFVHIITFY